MFELRLTAHRGRREASRWLWPVVASGFIFACSAKPSEKMPAATSTEANSTPSDHHATSGSPSGLALSTTPVIYGPLHEIIYRGDTRARIDLAGFVWGADAFGLGTIEGLRGEVTIWQGVLWSSQAQGSSISTAVDSTSALRLTHLVAVRVPKWQELMLDATSDLDQLAGKIAAFAAEKRLEAPVAFTYDGPIEAASWRVITPEQSHPADEDPAEHAEHRHANQAYHDHLRAARRGKVAGQSAKVVGFFSPRHRGVITSGKTLLTLHVIDEQGRVTGELESLQLPARARLKIAAPDE